jgi:hypothetical protein
MTIRFSERRNHDIGKTWKWIPVTPVDGQAPEVFPGSRHNHQARSNVSNATEVRLLRIIRRGKDE